MDKKNIENTIKENIGLSQYSTFKIGGTARYFAAVKDIDELKELTKLAKKMKTRVLFFSGGSNVLINDGLIDALVIKLSNNKILLKGNRIVAESGAFLSEIVMLAKKNSLSGIEWATGIPGSIGGAVRGNAGAYRSEISDVIENIEIININTQKSEIISKRECNFGYRESAFKKNNNLIIWKIILKLSNNTNPNDKIYSNIIKKRNNSQPRLPSAGSVFKNIKYNNLIKDNYKLALKAKKEGVVKSDKIAAGWLIDMLDLKGKSIGGAKVSLEHANFIVNTGSATSEDITTLICFIKQQVRDKLHIQLKEEIEYFGY